MRRLARIAALAALALAPAACRQQPEGALKVVVIGGEPKLRDPAAGPLSAPDAVLLANVAQGLVRFDAGGNIVERSRRAVERQRRWARATFSASRRLKWPDGRKVTAEQVVRLLKRQLAQPQQESAQGHARRGRRHRRDDRPRDRDPA